MDPLVFEEHSYKENELENTGVCPACAVTLAREKPLEEEEILLQDGTIETSDAELKHIVSLMSTITFYIAMGICIVISLTRSKNPV